MLLRENVQLMPFDEQRWLINTDTGHNLLVNKDTEELFSLLRTAESMDQACARFNVRFRANLSGGEFATLLQARFGGYGILTHDQKEDKAVAGSNYIRLKMELLSAKIAAICAAPLRVFYAPQLFWPIFFLLLAFLLIVYLGNSSALLPSGSRYWIILPLLYFSFFIHELGHIAACRRFGIRHGGIGFGFYLFIIPALYADVTNVWQTNRQRRIIVNLGGIFSQTLYAGLLAVGYLATSFSPLLLAATATMAVALWQFNPFVRHDGYWLLSDLLNTPNLQQKAAQVVKRSLSLRGLELVWSSRGRVLVGKQFFLFLYGAANSLLFIAFAAFTAVRYGDQFVQFPLLVTALLGKLTVGMLSLADLKQIPIIIASFYVLAMRYLFITLTTWQSSQKKAAIEA
ncbi:site-2 protease family protein [Hymenobacter metallicola]|uniref:Peptidase M50 domain-containing protein n=1 Tax=Hymenobacter metallicola TaxID=2563114 RepID=A0A4Z0QA77_9BACT|nr:site-2 protease family protein [Hymenobacter metallicola]TGE26635.1 hypothetical protein E5K02_17790 [Hymenobacter metallicola]